MRFCGFVPWMVWAPGSVLFAILISFSNRNVVYRYEGQNIIKQRIFFSLPAFALPFPAKASVAVSSTAGNCHVPLLVSKSWYQHLNAAFCTKDPGLSYQSGTKPQRWPTPRERGVRATVRCQTLVTNTPIFAIKVYCFTGPILRCKLSSTSKPIKDSRSSNSC